MMPPIPECPRANNPAVPLDDLRLGQEFFVVSCQTSVGSLRLVPERPGRHAGSVRRVRGLTLARHGQGANFKEAASSAKAPVRISMARRLPVIPHSVWATVKLGIDRKKPGCGRPALSSAASSKALGQEESSNPQYQEKTASTASLLYPWFGMENGTRLQLPQSISRRETQVEIWGSWGHKCLNRTKNFCCPALWVSI